MRVLLGCSLGGEGHLQPLARVGRAFERAGHDVVLLVPPALADSARRTGLPSMLGGEPPPAVVADIWERVRAGPPDAVHGLIDRELFAGRCAAAMLAPARDARDSFRPDLVVRESCEYASAVAAYEAGIAHAQVGISPAEIDFGVREMVAPILDQYARGVANAITASPYLTPFPSSLDPSPWEDTRRFRAVSAPVENATEWLPPSGQGPIVYVTFGTVLGHLPEAASVFRCALDAVAELPARFVMTVGRATDVTSLGAIPANTCVEQWVPQGSVLRHAAAVVCHGGSGTTLGALAAGVPLVICPLFADQARNARAVRSAGAGIIVAATGAASGGVESLGADDVALLRTSIEEVLAAATYGQAASRIAAEIADTPSVDTLIEHLIPPPRC